VFCTLEAESALPANAQKAAHERMHSTESDAASKQIYLVGHKAQGTAAGASTC
jgi:hypothetical protein